MRGMSHTTFPWLPKGRIVPRCYLLALAQSSTIDRESGGVSLFHLVEAAAYAGERPAELPFQVHIHWRREPGEEGTEFEVRVLRVAPDGTEEPGPAVVMTMPGQATRQRFAAVRAPSTDGPHELRVEWRKPGTEEWHLEPAFWPITLIAAAQPTSAAPPETTDGPAQQ